ncbi:MAG: PAS domain S-box protein [bacterium]
MTTPDYASIFEQLPDGIIVTDERHRIVAVNESFARMIGIGREVLIGRDPSELITAAELERQPPQTERLRSGTPLFSLRRLRTSSGNEIPVEILAHTRPDGFVVGVVRDVRHRLATEAGWSTEARLKAMTETLNVALVVTDSEDRALYVNDHMSALTGYEPGEIVGRVMSEFAATEADRAHVASQMEGRRSGAAEKYELLLRRKEGSSFTAEISASPMFDEQGRVVGSVAVIEDVTERDRHKRELEERERRYRSLFEVTPLPTWVFDVETLRFSAVNPAAIAHYGYTEEEFLSMTLLDIRTPEEARKFALTVDNDMAKSTPRPVEHRKKDGTIIQVEIVAENFVLDGRQSRLVVAHDVTDEVRLLERQQNVQDQLRLAQKMEAVGGLAGGVAHDFNNLLSIVLGASESIERDLPATSPLREDVKDIREAAERGAALTRQLLSLGRREVRAAEMLDVNAVVQNVSRLLARALGPRVHTDVRLDPGALTVVADAGQLEQVIVNLAINARDAMPEGGTLTISSGRRALSAVEASLAGVTPGVYVSLVMQDEGIGMDEATRARAFEPFFTTKGPHLGTGLGLATVYGIARQSDGGVVLDSAPGKGTRVTMYLPYVERLRNQELSRLSGEHPTTGTRGRVLLVEDEPRVRAQVRRLLERSGFSVMDAADGEQGLRQFQAMASTLDVVVSDVMMPVMGGVEMVSALRGLAPAVPVIFVSGYAANDRELPLDQRTLFIPKPYTIDILCDAIDSLLSG